MNALHTPGQWSVDYLDLNSQRVVMGEHFAICTCWHHSVGSIEKEMEANARLISAAPDLLEALEGAIEWMSCVEGHLRDGQPFQSNLAEYRAAISKARDQA